jgi:hypothetical protein
MIPMECPVNRAHPQPKYQFMGENRSGWAAALYRQACSNCDVLEKVGHIDETAKVE